MSEKERTMMKPHLLTVSEQHTFFFFKSIASEHDAVVYNQMNKLLCSVDNDMVFHLAENGLPTYYNVPSCPQICECMQEVEIFPSSFTHNCPPFIHILITGHNDAVDRHGRRGKSFQPSLIRRPLPHLST